METFPSLPGGLVFFFTLSEAKHANPENRDQHWSVKKLDRNPVTPFGRDIKGKHLGVFIFPNVTAQHLFNSGVRVIHQSS